MIRVLMLLLGLAQSAKFGKYEVSLRLPAEGLFAGEEMQIEFRVTDTSSVDPLMGADPVIRAKIQSAIDMPSMAGMPVIRETSHPEGVPGDYGLHPYFVHGGEFRLKLIIEPQGEKAFEAEFPLQVGDARPNRPKAVSPYKMSFDNNEIRITGPEGQVRNFDTVHEKKLHFIVVSKDLSYFAHLHPEPSDKGTFKLKETLPPGDLRLFADFAPQGKGGQVLMLPRNKSGKAPVIEDNLNVPAKLTGDLIAGKTTKLTLEGGLPLKELEPYLGAMAHLILIHEDGETFVHSHPIDDPAQLVFLARPPKAGKYKGWVEVQSKGKVMHKSFWLEATSARR
jgi:hypothetical protein